MVNETRLLTIYLPAIIVGAYWSLFYTNAFGIRSNAEQIVTSPNISLNLYLGLASISISMIGFVMVAMPFIISLFASKNLNTVTEEYRNKGGVRALLTYYIRVAVLFAITLVVSLLLLIGGGIGNVEAFFVVSTTLLVSVVYLFVAIFGLYLLIKTMY